MCTWMIDTSLSLGIEKKRKKDRKKTRAERRKAARRNTIRYRATTPSVAKVVENGKSNKIKARLSRIASLSEEAECTQLAPSPCGIHGTWCFPLLTHVCVDDSTLE